MKNKADYEGTYRIKSTPAPMKRHNEVSWQKIEHVIALDSGRADFYALVDAVKGHKHGTKTAKYPYQFITYCIRSGWLKRVERNIG